jgi:hypothetical protein
MPQRRILFLDATRLAAYRCSGGSVEPEGSFATDATGLEAFGTYLARHRDCVFSLLADVSEEGFQAEDIPYTSGKDRKSIISRKLAQFFYNTPLSAALSHGRLKTGRRDERLLMMALTRPQHFEPWLDLMREMQTILAGVYSLPQITQQLVSADAPPQLLLISQTHGGLRQTYFAERQLRFSRLTPLATGSAQEAAIATSIESAKMHQYLSSQRLIDRNRPLATRVLAHPAQIAAMRERCRDSAVLQFEFADLLQEAKRLGLRAPLADSRAEALFCHLLAQKSPSEQLAPPQDRQFYRLWQTRFSLKAASAVIFAGGLLFAAKQGLELWHTRDITDKLQQQSRLDQQRYDAMLQALPRIPLSTDNLRAFVDRYQQVELRAQGPAPLLVQLSRSLDAFPAIALDQVEWKITEKPDAAPGGAGAQPASPLAGGPYAQIVATARLPLGMVGDQRGQLALVAEFTKHLGAQASTQAVVLQPPVDTQSGKTLKSGDEKRTPEAPKFSFRLTRRL